MAEQITISDQTSKSGQYRELLPQIKGLVKNEPDLIANLANIAAALKQVFGFFWVGFYLVKKDELVLGPFQGPVACTRIKKGKGVCGQSWDRAETIVVEDVEKFPGHIACSPDSKSEIVVPVLNSSKEVVMVLDIDSDKPAAFTGEDKQYLEELAVMISGLLSGENNKPL